MQHHNMELDNLFDLDADIDFETAYQLFSNLDNIQEKNIDIFTQNVHSPTHQYNNGTEHLFRAGAHRLLADPTHNNPNLAQSLPEPERIQNYEHDINHHEIIHEKPVSARTPQLVTTPRLMDNALLLQHQPNGHSILSPSPMASPQFFNTHINTHNNHTQNPLQQHVHMNAIQNTVSSKNMPILNDLQNNEVKHPLNQFQLHPQSTNELLKHFKDSHMQRNNDTLLSTFESTAIENFLDSLVSNQKDNGQKNHGGPNSPIKHDNHNNLVAIPLADIPQDEPKLKPAKVTKVKEIVNTKSDDVSYLTINNDYIPPKIDIPEITVPDSEIPANLINDEKKIKKWKHVQVEKARRNFTKQSFDDLTDLISKDIETSSKRVPKYILLNAIVDDIKDILKANHKLEQMLYDKK
ncbi:hypothetical protein C6P45_001240 [Maudiozyma exigua]|uniref:BHLH domain-containing protein n=1 Tax=Maudiozyma exigua TaxID=34358 RepID=A0A9P7B629_MAUEX|nr:hypothetical protein C6P45_001240 [Kazachstania exigua]